MSLWREAQVAERTLASAAILLESADRILTEDGYFFLLES